MLAPRAALLGASLALVASAASGQSPLRIGKRRPPNPVVRPNITVETSTFELGTSAWPLVKVPAMATGSAPSPLPPPHPELRSIDSSTPPSARMEPVNPGQPRPPAARPRSTTVFRVEPTAPGLFVAGWSPQPETHNPTFSYSCGDGARSNRQVFYWELLQRTGDGAARLTSGETWIDTATCDLAGGARAELSLATAASLDGAPIAFGARTEQGLWLLFPQPAHFTSSTADPSPRSAQDQPSGVLSQTTIPVRKGDAVVASFSSFPHSINAWRYAFGMAPLEWNSVSHLPVSVRVDVSQSIREGSPLALLTLQRPVPGEHAAPGGEPGASGSLGLSGVGRLDSPPDEGVDAGMILGAGVPGGAAASKSPGSPPRLPRKAFGPRAPRPKGTR